MVFISFLKPPLKIKVLLTYPLFFFNAAANEHAGYCFHLFTNKQKTSYHVHQRDKLYVFQNYEKRGLEKFNIYSGSGLS